MKPTPKIKLILKDSSIIANNMKEYHEYKKYFGNKIIDEVLILYASATLFEEIGSEYTMQEFR